MATEPADLEARVRRLEDLAAINQLFVDYGAHLDAHDFDAYAALFADEGEVLLGPLGRAKGRDSIKSLMEKAMPGPPGGSFHIVSNPVVTLEGEQARTKVMWTVVQRDGSGRPHVAMIGHHRDELIRRDGRWLFLRRAGYVDIPSSYPGGEHVVDRTSSDD